MPQRQSIQSEAIALYRGGSEVCIIFGAKLVMRASEPKPHKINTLLVSFDSEVRKRGCRMMMRASESGH